MSSLSTSSPETARVPWSKTISIGPTSSFAPGPPSRILLDRKTSPLPKMKKSAKITISSLPEMKMTAPAEYHQNGKGLGIPSDPVDAIKEAAERKDIEGWDPRKFDYGSSKFNSYTEGPGQVVQTREQKNVIALFVDHIPTAITKEGLRNMFSEAGTVKRVSIPPAKLGKNTAYGFVEFSTVREAENAIQLLQNKDMGRGNRLVVKIAESKKNREDRLRIRKAEEEFIKTLHCGKNDEGNYEQNDSDYEAEDNLSNPLQPRYISNNVEKSDEGVSSGMNSLNSSGVASSYNALSDKADSEKHSLDGGGIHSPRNGVSYGSSTSSDAETFALFPCTVCQKLTNSRCTLCKTYYCSTKCQSQDWPRHRQECGHKKKSCETPNPPADTATNTSLPYKTSELCIADNSDDDGFVFDGPSANDLVPVKELLHQAMDNGDLASLIAEGACSGGFASLPLPSDQLTQVDDEQSDSEDKSLVGATLLMSLPLVKTSSRKTPPFSPPQSEAIKSLNLQPFKVASSSSAFLSSSKPSAMCSSLSIVDGALHASKHNSPMNLELGLASPGLTCSGIDAPAEDSFVPVNLIHSQFGLIKQPLLSLPLTSFPPPEFQAIVTFYFSPTQFNVIIPSVEVKQAIQLIRSIGTTLEPGKLLASQLTRGSKCGYKDKLGEFLRVTVSKVCSPEEVVVHRYDFGGDLSVPVWELSCLPEELVFIPCLTHRCCLQDLFISNHGRANQSVAFRVLEELVNGEPVTIQNLSPGYNPNVSCLLCSLKNNAGTVDLSNALLSSPYVTSVAGQARETSSLTSPLLKLSCIASKVPYHHVHPGTTVVILPTVVVNPSIIWAQIIHPNFSMIEEMHRDLNAFYPPVDISLSPYMPVVGEICVAKYSQDQKYYRAEVISVNHSGTVDVRFTETGLTEIVNTTQLHHVLPVFLTMPRQARKFRMCDVVPIQSSWSNNAIAFLKDKILNRRVSVRIVAAMSNELVSEIFDPELDNQILNNSLILLRHAQACHNDSALNCSSKTNLRGVSVLATPPDSPLKETLLKSSFSPLRNPHAQKLFYETNNLDDTGRCSHPSGGFLDSPKSGIVVLKESTSSQLHNTSQRVILSAGDCVSVTLSHVIGLERFCVQLATPGNLAKVQVMLKKIENAVLVPLPPEQYQKGKRCLCLYPEDDHVHRAVIKSYTNNKVVVIFEDYGNTFSTSDHIYQATEELFDLPFQAIVCSLYQVRNPAGTKKEWDPVALNFFHDILARGQPKIKVVEVVGALHVVDMHVSSSEGVVNVLKTLCEAGYVMYRRPCRERRSSTRNIPLTARHQDRSKDGVSHRTSNICVSNTQRTLGDGKTRSPQINNTVSVLTPCIQMSYPSVSTMKKLSFPRTNKPFSVVVCEVVTIHEIYVQMVTDESAFAINNISEALSSSLPSSLVFSSSFPPVGSLCCAKFSQDQLWYRCQVESVCGDRISVFFVDYGNRDSVVLSDVAPCPALCTSVPTVAIKCGLAGLTSLVVQGDKAVEFLREHTSDCMVSAKVVSEIENIPQVLMTTNDLDFVDEMTKQGIIVSSKTEIVYPFVASLETMQLPTRAGVLKVLITNVTSPSEIYLQVGTADVRTIFIKIREGINAYFKSHPPQFLSSFPKVGSLCCAKSFANKLWYRVEVLQVVENSCIVFFVDYGNKETVSLSDIAACPFEFSSQPLLAVRCGLGGLPSSCIVSAEKVTQYLNKHTVDAVLLAKVVGKDDGTPLLELHNDKGMELLEEMSKLGLVSLVPKYSLPLVQDMVCCTLPNSGAFQVMVTEVVNAMEFYVQLATTEVGAMLSRITEGINNKTQPLQPLSSSSLAEGSLCCAKFSVDRQWYRVEVLHVKEKSCLVFFVDFGNKDVVSPSDMATCPDEFSSLPIVAVKCGLNGLPPKLALSDKIKVHLLQCFSNSLVSASVVCVTDNLPILEIQKDGKSLLDDMSELGLLDLPVPKISLPLVKGMSHIPFPISGTFQVMVTEVVSPMDFFIQVATTEVGVMLSRITEGINRETHPLQPLSSHPEVDSLCCARFSVDRQWYRVAVLQVKEKSCLVFFVDFGNKDEVPLSDMAICPSDFSSLPLIAVNCSLSGLSSGINLAVEATNIFRQLSANSLLSAKMVDKTNGIPKLELSNPEKCLLDEILRHNLATEPSTSLLPPLVASMKKMILPSSSGVDAMVIEIVNLSEMYIQMATQEVALLLTEMLDSLNQYFDSDPSSFLSPPPVGSLCCAKFSQDSMWYRAEVLTVEGDDKYTVHFIDYGNKDTLSLSSLAACPSQFAILPIIAVCCSLDGVSPSSVVSMDLATNYLKEITFDVVVSINVISTIDGIPQVKLSIKDREVVTVMTEEGLIIAQHPSADLKMLQFPPTSEFVECLIYEVVNFSEFYLHVNNEERSTVLGKINKAIELLFASGPPKPLVVAPSVGDLCLAKFSEDKCWYRVRVKAVNGTVCEVLYLDYRNTETVDLSSMVPCPAEIASLPQIAIKCGMGGIQSDNVATAEKVSVFRKLTSNNCVFSATYLSDADGVPQLQLVKDGKSLLSLLGLSLSNFPMVANMKKLQFPSSSETFQLLVCELNSPREMYVQVNNECTVSSLKAITMGLEKFCAISNPEPLSSPPPIGSLCCAKFAQDDTWYRARIDGISGDCCQVLFIDFGNSDEVHLTQMAVCPPDILDFPVVAIRCGLLGVYHLSPSQSVCPASSLKILKHLVFGHLLNASVVNDKLGECPVVQLAEISDGTLISVKFQDMYQSSGSSLCKCQVTELNNPESLYFQYIHADNANNLDLLNKLQDAYACPSAYKDFIPTVGSLCCAQFTGDLCWYRCKVMSVTKDSIGLYYIDFGSVESLPSNEVYCLDKEFTALPPLAVHCKINGIRPKQAKGWGKDVVDKLIDLCDKKFLFASVVGSEGDPVAVDLFQDEDHQYSIADSLVASGHAIYT